LAVPGRALDPALFARSEKADIGTEGIAIEIVHLTGDYGAGTAFANDRAQ